jgi:hypothetical protein
MPELDRNKWIILIVVVVVLLIGLGTLFAGAGGSALRDEVPENVDLIRLAEIEYEGAFEEFVSADAAPRDPLAVDGTPVPWKPSRGFEKLSWKPQQTEVYGAYSVNARADGFTVLGVCDVDSDREQARFQATKDDKATMQTDESIF